MFLNLHRVNLPGNRSVNLDNVFTNDPEGVINYHQSSMPDHRPRGDPGLNSSRSTVVALYIVDFIYTP